AAEVDTALANRDGAGRVGPPAESPGRPVSVGRAAERAPPRRGFESAEAGRGPVVCVAGEPGLGQTTLVAGFPHEPAAGDRPCELARGRCSERLAGTEAYLPFLDVLDDLLQNSGGPAARVMKAVAPTWYVQLAPSAVDDPAVARAVEEAKGAPQ